MMLAGVSIVVLTAQNQGGGNSTLRQYACGNPCGSYIAFTAQALAQRVAQNDKK